MFENLTSSIKDLLKDAGRISEQIEDELEALHEKRAKRIEELNNLQNKLPQLNRNYKAIAKAFGYSENSLTKGAALNAKDAIQKAADEYARLEESLKEIELSINALEEEITV